MRSGVYFFVAGQFVTLVKRVAAFMCKITAHSSFFFLFYRKALDFVRRCV